MTTTQTTVIDWDSRTFAYIEVDREIAECTWHTVGHDDDRCARITGSSLATNSSLDAVATANEFWDGEFTYLTPWPCGACVEVETGRTSAVAEVLGQLRGAGYGQARPAAVAPVDVDSRTAEAVEFARTYAGSFDFMLSMRDKAARRSWTPTPKMVDAILRCKARDAASVPSAAPQAAEAAPQAAAPVRPNRFAGTCRTCGQDVPAGAGRIDKVAGAWVAYHLDGQCPKAAAPLADVPEGHYAITSTGHNDLAFYRVDRPAEGKWAGRTFVKMMVGGHPDMPVRRDAVPGILARIAEAGVQESAALYGQEIGRCCRCNRSLTDETSRRLGIGPECRSKGW